MDVRFVKILLLILLLFSLLDNPYWYYQLVRIFATIGFSYTAYSYYKNKIKILPLVFVLAAILFNPIIKISFDRDAWTVIDIVFAMLLLVTLVMNKFIINNLKDA